MIAERPRGPDVGEPEDDVCGMYVDIPETLGVVVLKDANDRAYELEVKVPAVQNMLALLEREGGGVGEKRRALE